MITTHPSNQTVPQGQPATFNVVASGSATLTYQWQRDQVNIAGATASSYTLQNALFADSGAKFRVIVTNGFGSATSNEATLTVNAPPSINGQRRARRSLRDSRNFRRDGRRQCDAYLSMATRPGEYCRRNVHPATRCKLRLR
jgi:hypothetical protein